MLDSIASRPHCQFAHCIRHTSVGCIGVLQIEAMAQLAGICMLDPDAEKKDQFFFGGIENCRWRKPVVPGDTLVRAALLTADVLPRCYMSRRLPCGLYVCHHH